jgi:hypothetical protein
MYTLKKYINHQWIWVRPLVSLTIHVNQYNTCSHHGITDKLLIWRYATITYLYLLREEVWSHVTRLTPPLFIEVPVPLPECEWSCMCVSSIDVAFDSTMFRLDCWTVPTLWNCFVFHFISYSAFIVVFISFCCHRKGVNKRKMNISVL